MADIERSAEAVWHGNLREGEGTISTQSGVLKETPYTFTTRFGDGAGTNPEELIASAHAACFTMALANLLSTKEHKVHHINTRAIVYLSETAPRTITKIRLETVGTVEDIDEGTFLTNAEETKRTCIVSRALAAVEIELDAKLSK
ncbi:MAG: OsmC family peroxiredoxin [Chloroflexota bacterium]